MWIYHNPVAIHAGVGVLSRLPELLGARRAILVAFPEAASLGLVETIQALLGHRLAAVETDIRANPDVGWVAPLYDRLWDEHPDVECVIALGGGSSIDCAKALLTATASGRFDELRAHLEGQPLAAGARRHRALIAIPTTAGTGSEVTPWATLWDSAGNRKHSLHLPWTWPQAALIDPRLMLSLPAETTRASALDALSHAFEAMWNIHRNPVSSALASQAARSIMQVLPALMRQPSSLPLREQMAVASLQAGLAFSNTKTALAHSLSYALTLEQGVPHGIACSFSLPRIMELAFGHDPQLDALLLDTCKATTSGAAIAGLHDFLLQLGVQTDPAAYGISPTDWQQRITHALEGPRGRNFIAADSFSRQDSL